MRKCFTSTSGVISMIKRSRASERSDQAQTLLQATCMWLPLASCMMACMLSVTIPLHGWMIVPCTAAVSLKVNFAWLQGSFEPPLATGLSQSHCWQKGFVRGKNWRPGNQTAYFIIHDYCSRKHRAHDACIQVSCASWHHSYNYGVMKGPENRNYFTLPLLIPSFMISVKTEPRTVNCSIC